MFTRFVKDAGSLLTGVANNLNDTRCFKSPKLSGSDSTAVPLKSRTLRDIFILRIKLSGIFVKSLFSQIRNEQIRGRLNQLNLFWLNKIRVLLEHSFSTFNSVKPLPSQHEKCSSSFAIRIAKSRRAACILKQNTRPS